MEMTEALNTLFIQGTFIPHSIQFSISHLNKIIRDHLIQITQSLRSLDKRQHIKDLQLSLIHCCCLCHNCSIIFLVKIMRSGIKQSTSLHQCILVKDTVSLESNFTLIRKLLIKLTEIFVGMIEILAKRMPPNQATNFKILLLPK